MARPAGTVPITPGTAKYLKTSCKAIAHAYNIESAPLESFVEVCRYYFSLFDLTYCAVSNAFIHDGRSEGALSQNREDAQQSSNQRYI
jgi:hypothetical protein